MRISLSDWDGLKMGVLHPEPAFVVICSLNCLMGGHEFKFYYMFIFFNLLSLC